MRRLLYVALALTLAGCLPSSCRRTAPRALTAADSLSRQLAAEVPMDTLRLVWQTEGPEADRMAFPRTVRFGPDSTVVVSDAEENRLLVFSENGQFVRAVDSEALEAPYLVGFRGDTALVFAPAALRLDFFLDGRRVRTLPLQWNADDDALRWAAASEDAFYAKVVSDDGGGAVARFDERGRLAARQPLPGSSWRRAGELLLWDDRLVSLSGYRPVLDLLPPDLAAPPDTLALAGFDSPMLARSRSFLQGDVQRPPLLIEAAAPVGDWLFVLNLRPGWLQIDVYDQAGRLHHRLTQADPSTRPDFYPRDLAVRRRADGRYDLAVVFSHPQPALELYRWPARP